MNGDVALGNVEMLRDESAAACRKLAGAPEFELAVLVMRAGGSGFERCMGNERIRIGGFHNLGAVLKAASTLPSLFSECAGACFESSVRFLCEAFAALRCGNALVPFHIELFARG